MRVTLASSGTESNIFSPIFSKLNWDYIKECVVVLLIKSVFLAAQPPIWLMYSFHWYCPCATSSCQKSQLFLQREPPSESEATQIFSLFVVQKLKFIALGASCFLVDETKTTCQEGILPIIIIITTSLACLHPKLHNHILNNSQKRKPSSQWW